jgi:hypothetical protein
MRDINSKGSALVGLLIVTAIAAALIFGYQFLGEDDQTKNQIEAGQDAIDAAQDAANAQNQGSLYLQNEIQDSPPVNFHGVQDQLKNLKR